MSLRARRWAERQIAGGVGPKAVLLVLAGLVDEGESCCSPTQEALALATEQSVRTVQRQLRQLEARGLLSRQRRYEARGARAPESYELLIAPREHPEAGGLVLVAPP